MRDGHRDGRWPAGLARRRGPHLHGQARRRLRNVGSRAEDPPRPTGTRGDPRHGTPGRRRPHAGKDPHPPRRRPEVGAHSPARTSPPTKHAEPCSHSPASAPGPRTGGLPHRAHRENPDAFAPGDLVARRALGPSLPTRPGLPPSGARPGAPTRLRTCGQTPPQHRPAAEGRSPEVRFGSHTSVRTNVFLVPGGDLPAPLTQVSSACPWPSRARRPRAPLQQKERGSRRKTHGRPAG